MKRILYPVTVAAILLLFLPFGSAADERTKTYIRMEETEIIGIIEHPEITYIIPKTRIRFKHTPLERTFGNQITGVIHLLDLEKEIYLRSQFGKAR